MAATGFEVGRPQAGENAAYFDRYISLVSDADILKTLHKQGEETVALFSQCSASQAEFCYAPEKWSVKQVVGHVSDAERIFLYRALRIARNDQTPIEGFDENEYVRWGGFETRSYGDLVEEFAAVRKDSLAFFRGLEEAAWARRGVVNKNETSVRALAYIIAGHVFHHGKILRERYFSQFSKSA